VSVPDAEIEDRVIAERRPANTLCGRCGHVIAPYDGVYLVTAKKLPRCETCAKQYADTLPDLPVHTPEDRERRVKLPREHTASVGQRFSVHGARRAWKAGQADFKAKQAGEQ
jgi:hypothetical protein